MAQEVQTTLNYKAELNLIEWVWHQENKVREHTQVEQAFGYECYATGYIYLLVSGTTPPTKATITLNSMEGNTEFKIVDWWLRIPLSWAYLAHMEFSWGSSSVTVNHYIKIDWETIVQQNTNSTWYTWIDKILNLWRYNVIEFRAWWSYGGSGWVWTAANFRLTLKKL